jgi:release factor glutamine methyltransferase
MVSLKQASDDAANRLTTISDSPRLDAELLIEQVAGHSKTHQYAYPESQLTKNQAAAFAQAVDRRAQGEPIAYIIGYQDFWTFKLRVTPAVLIPRPETECLIEWLLAQFDEKTSLKVADLGVGSGAIALALATERPRWTIHATDASSQAIALAKHNAEALQINHILFYQGHWCDALPDNDYDVIVSNPPYIATGDQHLGALSHEPMMALAAGQDGLEAIKVIADQARSYLKPQGLLVYEHGYDQSQASLSLLKHAGYVDVKDHVDLSLQPRFTSAILLK